MTVNSPEDIEGLKRIGKIVALAIAEMKKHVKPGITTRELDEIGERFLRKHGAVSAPKKVYNFPGATCISVNQEVAHGIPGNRTIQPGDLINIDVSAELDGYFADSGHSFQVPPYDRKVVRLCRYTHRTMMNVITRLKAGVKINEIGRMIQTEARNGGYNVIKNLCSHGIGRSLHEEPQQILNFYDPHQKGELTEGLVITIEPFLSTGIDFVVEQPDGWTLKVPDNSFVAQHEHTIIITKDKPLIVTCA